MKRKNLMKKLSVLSLIGCLLISMLPATYHADNTEAGPKAGVVDEVSIPEDAIYISTTYDLIEFAENCIDEEYSKGKVFVLKQDIHMTGVDFSGVPTFGGTFLGQGHKLHGLEFEQDEDVTGFFRYLQKDAVVNGLILQINVQPDGSNTLVGGIAGVNKGTIRNCIVNGVVSGKTIVGGLVGLNKVTGVIENCTMNGLVHGESMVGGFAGKNQGVVRECLSNAEVNTAVEHNTIGMDMGSMSMDMDDIEFSFDLDMNMNSFGFSESMDSATDIGGIAGYNTGVIRSCVNKGNVGYEKMSTNVGGIVGTSSGYIVDCVNYAEINGSTNVGGIAGKLQSCIVITYTESDSSLDLDSMDSIEIEISDDDMQSIKDMLNDLEEEDDDEVDSEETEIEIPDSSEDLEDIEIPESTEDWGDIEIPESTEDWGDIEIPESTEDWGDIEIPESTEDWGDIEIPESTEDFGDMELPEDMEDIEDIELPEELEDLEDLETDGYDDDQSDAAWNDLSNSLGDSLEDTDISEELDTGDTTELSISLEGMDFGFNTEYDDVSRDDTESDTVAKTYLCVNYGNVYASKYAGGIAGKADDGTSSDEEDENEEEKSDSAEYAQRLVIRDCTNYATIEINNKYAGGIVGRMKIGAIFNANNLGNLDCLNADYVGGIAGRCDSVIFNSITKCIIAGSDYVGGIAGQGYECYDSCAFVDIAAATKYVGSIFGSTEELPDDRAEAAAKDTDSEDEEEDDDGPLVTNNTYYTVGKNIGGIDGINYSGVSKRITIEEFLAKENLPDVFKNVSIRFVVEGQDDVVLTVPTNGTLALDQLPVLEVAEGEVYEWVYEKPVTSEVLAMGEEEEVLYLSEARLTGILFDQTYEADFEPKDMVAQGKDKTPEGKTKVLAIGAFDSTTDIVLENMLSTESEVLGVRVNENWKVTLSNIGVKELRYYVPAELDAENLTVYVKDAEGNWKECEYTIIGSYIAFDFTDGNQGFALCENASAGVGVVAIIVAVVFIAGVLVVRKKKAAKTANVENK